MHNGNCGYFYIVCSHAICSPVCLSVCTTRFPPTPLVPKLITDTVASVWLVQFDTSIKKKVLGKCNSLLLIYFKIWTVFLALDFFYPQPMRIKRVLSVRSYPEKIGHPIFVNVSPTLVIDTPMERSSRVLQHEKPKIWISFQKKSKLNLTCILTCAEVLKSP